VWNVVSLKVLPDECNVTNSPAKVLGNDANLDLQPASDAVRIRSLTVAGTSDGGLYSQHGARRYYSR